MAVWLKHTFMLTLFSNMICAISSDEELVKGPKLGLTNSEDGFLELASRVERLESRDRRQQAEIKSLNVTLRTQERKAALLGVLVERYQTRKLDVNGEPSKRSISDGGYYNDDSSQATANKGLNMASRASTTAVGFYATLSNHALNIGVNKAVVFERVVTNVGDDYNSLNGHFTAPADGLYVFSVTLMAYGDVSDYYKLTKNGQEVSRMYAKADTSPYMVTGQTAVLQLSVSDVVEVRTLGPNGNVHGGDYSSFAGFLLYLYAE